MALITRNDLKVELNMADQETSFDALLDSLALAVQSLFDQLTGRTIEEAEFTEYYNSDSYNDVLALKNWPVKGKDYIEIWDDPDWEWGSDSKLAATDFTVDLPSGIVYYDGMFFQGKQSIKVVYTAGYTTTTLPAAWKQSFVRQGGYWFQSAKVKSWHVQMLTPPGAGGGGSMMTKTLQDDLLPDFAMLVSMNRR